MLEELEIVLNPQVCFVPGAHEPADPDISLVKAVCHGTAEIAALRNDRHLSRIDL